ncbi:hypothetical protein CISIN_1g035352mg [Citrus sinensis]|uniref:Uncharacterized protein n=1 Tax=Citrus sinensis TaxID=2711 RepID=A0A067EKK4_CITSI|nr:hypothetical protein CISIN_1g035352mg [Citrus sinensis]
MRQKSSNTQRGGRVHNKAKRKRKSEVCHIICSEIGFSVNMDDGDMPIQFEIVLNSLDQGSILISHHR